MFSSLIKLHRSLPRTIIHQTKRYITRSSDAESEKSIFDRSAYYCEQLEKRKQEKLKRKVVNALLYIAPKRNIEKKLKS